MRPKLPMHWPGAHCFVLARRRGNSRGVKGAGHPRRRGVNGATGGTPGSGGRRRPSSGWHEPDESRGSCPDLWEARGAIPRAYPATGNRVKSNRIAAGAAKAQPNSHREAKTTAPYSYSGGEILRRRFSTAVAGPHRCENLCVGPADEVFWGLPTMAARGRPTATGGCAKHEMF
jgi:hypothetical protein